MNLGANMYLKNMHNFIQHRKAGLTRETNS